MDEAYFSPQSFNNLKIIFSFLTSFKSRIEYLLNGVNKTCLYDVKAAQNERTIKWDLKFSNERQNERMLIFVIISSYCVPTLASATTDVRIFVYIVLFVCTVDLLESK